MKKRPVRDTPIFDVSDMESDDLTSEIEKTLKRCEGSPKEVPEEGEVPKRARWSYWT